MTQEFFSEKPFWPSHFYKIIPLHEEKGLQWHEMRQLAPLLPRGWFELSALSAKDRIDFTLRYWLSKLSFTINKGIFLEERLEQFFDNLEDIGIFITQDTPSSSFDAHMVYSIKEEVAFFHGYPPASEEALQHLTQQFENVLFPKDYLGFLEIHDGFCKYMDRGLIKAKEMAKTYLIFQADVKEDVLISQGVPIDPATLIPFYESMQLHAYRCFYSEWVPEEEIGNIYYSLLEKNEIHGIFEEGPAYSTFMAWLLDYLEERCTG